MIYLFTDYNDSEYIHFFYKNEYIYSHNTTDNTYIKYLWIDNKEIFDDEDDNPVIAIKKFKYNLPTILNTIHDNDFNLHEVLSNIINNIIFGKLC